MQEAIDRITRAVGLVLVSLPKTIAVGAIMLPMVLAFYVKHLLGREAEPIPIRVAVEREDQVKPSYRHGPFVISYEIEDPEWREAQEVRYWFQVCMMLILLLIGCLMLLPQMNRVIQELIGA